MFSDISEDLKEKSDELLKDDDHICIECELSRTCPKNQAYRSLLEENGNIVTEYHCDAAAGCGNPVRPRQFCQSKSEKSGIMDSSFMKR